MPETLRIFLAWWRDRLLELLPGHAERRLSTAGDGMVLSLADAPDGQADGLWVQERRRGTQGPPTRLALDEQTVAGLAAGAARNRLPLVLRLPAALLLEREVALPAAAERELTRVLFHEMDRFTPFPAGEVHWSGTVQRRDRAQGRIWARLSLVQRAAAEPTLSALAAMGLRPAALELAAPGGGWRRIFLDGQQDGRRRDALAIALAALAVLAVIAVALPFLQQAREAAALDRQVRAAQPAMREVQKLHAAAAAGTTGSFVIAEQRHRAGDALEALALLTEALPDDTYLTALTFDAGRLTMDGQSRSAAALIAPLTANQRLQDVSFTAPVVRNTLGTDSFSMRLRVTH